MQTQLKKILSKLPKNPDYYGQIKSTSKPKPKPKRKSPPTKLLLDLKIPKSPKSPNSKFSPPKPSNFSMNKELLLISDKSLDEQKILNDAIEHHNIEIMSSKKECELLQFSMNCFNVGSYNIQGSRNLKINGPSQNSIYPKLDMSKIITYDFISKSKEFNQEASFTQAMLAEKKNIFPRKTNLKFKTTNFVKNSKLSSPKSCRNNSEKLSRSNSKNFNRLEETSFYLDEKKIEKFQSPELLPRKSFNLGNISKTQNLNSRGHSEKKFKEFNFLKKDEM